jgi:hypothetical protein
MPVSDWSRFLNIELRLWVSGMPRSWARTTLWLFLCSLAVTGGDLTGELVDESRSLANVIGKKDLILAIMGRFTPETDCDDTACKQVLAKHKYWWSQSLTRSVKIPL